ncbi:MAG: hypothetical protein M3R36_15405 [Bacteroidota bacterium]|nr:hypothetical protein [Bacteroidota bacterium]
MNEEVKLFFTNNNYVLNKNLEGISQEESLKCPDAGGNCLNWIVGHIVVTRDSLHELLGVEKMCSDKIVGLYKRGSVPINAENAEGIENLLKMYNDSQEKIIKILDEKDYKEDLEKSNELAGSGFHEAYHVGQTGVLRRVAGKPGAIK